MVLEAGWGRDVGVITITDSRSDREEVYELHFDPDEVSLPDSQLSLRANRYDGRTLRCGMIG